jgi:HAD superfamily hydrolase (TIGR01450 family)
VPDAGQRLDDVRGFMFDIDGTLVHRGPDGRGRPQPGAAEVLDRIRASGRPLVLFTNGSHVAPDTIAGGLREDGLPVGDDEVLTPVQSAITYLRRRLAGRRALLFASEEATALFVGAGIPLARDEDAELVFVAHVDDIDFGSLERAARAVSRGAPLLTGSYVPGYAGSNGVIFSRGAMITAAIAKVTGVRPKVLGKPSRAAVAELGVHLGVPTGDLAVIGDDLSMDIALGRMGGSRTVLVRSGISGQIDLARVPDSRRPHAVVDGVADLLPLL